jgi:hypothetical protein
MNNKRKKKKQISLEESPNIKTECLTRRTIVKQTSCQNKNLLMYAQLAFKVLK